MSICPRNYRYSGASEWAHKTRDIVQQKVNRHRNIKSRHGNSSKSTMFASVVKTANHEAF
jgi:hypothetical protein